MSIPINSNTNYDQETSEDRSSLNQEGASSVAQVPLSNSPNFSTSAIENAKHSEENGTPLHTSWTFWIDKTFRGCTAEEYLANLKEVYSFSTVEGFWSVIYNIPEVDVISPNHTYHMMREKRRPMWEDKENLYGGTWKFKVLKSDTKFVWRELLLAAIGEQFDDSLEKGDDICGISVAIKDREDLVQIWNLDCSLANGATIFDKVHKMLPQVKFLMEFYKPHQSHHAYEGERRQASHNK